MIFLIKIDHGEIPESQFSPLFSGKRNGILDMPGVFMSLSAIFYPFIGKNY